MPEVSIPDAYMDAKNVGEMLRIGISRKRRDDGKPWTPSDLRKAIQVSNDEPHRVTVWQWCNNKRHMSPEWLIRCADALGWDALLRLKALELMAASRPEPRS